MQLKPDPLDTLCRVKPLKCRKVVFKSLIPIYNTAWRRDLPEFSLDTIAEVSVALAGFSGLAAAFRRKSMREWAEWERVWFWYILAWSFVSLLFSILPAALGGLGIGPSSAWLFCNVFLAISIGVAIGHGVLRGLRLHCTGLAHPQPGLTSAALLPAVAAVALLLSSVAGVGPPPSGAYQFALFVTLGLACGSFLLFLQYPLSE
jgi:hypothetical protein